MRTVVFTLLAVVVGTAIQLGLTNLSYSVDHALGKFVLVLMFVLPVAVTVGFACAVRTVNLGYVIILSVVSPFLTWILAVLFSVGVLNERLYP